MKKTMSILLVTIMLFAFLIPSTGCADKPDYASPHDAIVAQQSGENIIGKTMKVVADKDVTLGFIYTQTDISVGANVGVGIYTDSNNLHLDQDYTGIHKGQTVIVKIVDYDDHLKTSINFLVTPIK